VNVRIDRKRIFIFVAIAYGLSIALGLVLFFNGGLGGSPVVLPGRNLPFILMGLLMFAPTVANIATRLITREGWANTYLRPKIRRGWRFYLAAWFLPALAAFVGGAIYYLLFPGQSDPSLSLLRSQMAQAPELSGMDPWRYILIQKVFTILVAPWISMFLAIGEEFGWRAYLLQKLLPLGTRKAVLIVGVIWGVWHWPFLFMGYNYGLNYWGAPVTAPLLFVVLTCFLSTFLTWVTLRSGSVWPAAIGHGAVNATSYLMAFLLIGEPDLLIGPLAMGIIGSLGYALLALLIFFNPRALAQPAFIPAGMPASGNRGAGVNAADQTKLGTAS